MSIVTRFAPSPTGFLHIGGARTALFNWIYTKHCNGKMLLRIEDTDRKRSTKEAYDAIIEGLKWLGIDWSGEIISQYDHQARHAEIAYELVKNGKAYYCTANSDSDKPAIRIKAPKEGETVIHDLVQGNINFPNKDLDDFVILRSDGTPTYMLAVVVDDHDMKVTHIIRGDDHLTNAARQTLIYNAMGWQLPNFAHIPLIHGEDGAKLSKRHGALGVEAYRNMGYLPTAIKNYLIRLGWSHGNEEIMSIEQIIEWFDIKNVNKGAARFDLKKLTYLNAHYIKNSNSEELYKYASYFKDLSQHREKYLKVFEILKFRAKTIIELLEISKFAIQPGALQPEDSYKHILRDFTAKLELCQDWQKESLNSLIKNFIEEKNIKMPDLGKPLRVALTGEISSLGITDILIALGYNETLSRLKQI